MCSCGCCELDSLTLLKGDTGQTGATITVGSAVVYNNVSDVATTAVITEETIVTVPVNLVTENILTTDGDELHVEGYWTTANNANNKTHKIYFGSTVIYNVTQAFTNQNIVVKCVIKRISSTSQIAYTYSLFNGTTSPVLTSLSENLATGSVNIKWAQQNGVATAADSVSKFRTIYKLKK